MEQRDVIFDGNGLECPRWAPWAVEGSNRRNCQADITTRLIPAIMREGSAQLVEMHFSLLNRLNCASGNYYIEMGKVKDVGLNRSAMVTWLEDIAKYDPPAQRVQEAKRATASA